MSMTAAQFDALSEPDKKIALFEADKITERFEDSYKIELFRIGDFYVEITTSPDLKVRRTLKTYQSWELPDRYRFSKAS